MCAYTSTVINYQHKDDEQEKKIKNWYVAIVFFG